MEPRAKSSPGKEQPKRLLTRTSREKPALAQARSIFHVPMPPNPYQECKESMEHVAKFTDSLQQLCGAGTQTAYKLGSLLMGTSYGEVAGQFLLLQRQIEEVMMAVTTGVQNDITEVLARLSHNADDKKQSHQDDDLRVVATGMALMLQLQQQFFLNATEKLAIFSQCHTIGSNGLQANKMSLHQDGVDPHSSRPSEAGPSEYSAKNKTTEKLESEKYDGMDERCFTTPNGIRKQLASLFSKTVTESEAVDSQSAWFVDLEQEAGSSREGAGYLTTASPDHKVDSANQNTSKSQQAEGSVQSQNPSSDHVTTSNVHTDYAQSDQQGAGVSFGQPVSQEELDVVIEMLSRSNKYSPNPSQEPCYAVPIICPPNVQVPPPPLAGHMSKAPGSYLYGMANSSHVAHAQGAGSVNEHVSAFSDRAVQHRQSDGFISEVNNSGQDTKTNTWPFKPRHKEPMWAGGEYLQSNPMYFPQAPYNPGHQEVPPYGMGQDRKNNAVIPGIPAGPWSMAPSDGSTQKGWPAFTNIAGDSEVAGGRQQWSAAADSSSCSDESSSNGDIQWVTGNPGNLPDMKRRHSSGGEDTALAQYGIAPNNNINKSVDCLMESKNMNTWPTKTPWGTKQAIIEDMQGTSPHDLGLMSPLKGGHRPLMPQWSDPIATRPLTVWDGGLSGSMSQQIFCSSTGGLPVDYSSANHVRPQADETKPF